MKITETFLFNEFHDPAVRLEYIEFLFIITSHIIYIDNNNKEWILRPEDPFPPVSLIQTVPNSST